MVQNQHLPHPPKSRSKARRSGYLSFDIGEVKRLSESDSPNAEAYGYLYQAVTTKPGTPKGNCSSFRGGRTGNRRMST